MEALSNQAAIALDEAPKNVAGERLLSVIGAAKSSLASLGFATLGMLTLIGIWWLTSVVTKYEIPTPAATWIVFKELLNDPFYDAGPNDKGIGLQLWSSIVRVFTGFGLGSLIAIPLGILLGANDFCRKIFYPIIQILKPVSPLAWFPIGLMAFQSAEKATIFIIFITSLWPTLINTAFGVASLPQDHKNVAKVFGFSTWQYITKILLPFSLPHTTRQHFTGHND